MARLVVERSIWITASREQVWEAITQPEKLMGWFVPNMPFAQMQRDDEGKVSLHIGEMGIDLVMMEIVTPLHQITLNTLPDRLITITYTLADQTDGTLVTVALAGLEKLPENMREDRLHITGLSWDKTLKNMKAYLEGKDLPFPQAFVAPLFGYWREPAQKIAVERSIWINAAPERVWRAVTDPKHLQKWLSPNTPWQLSALEVGGRYYVLDSETNAETYVEVIELLDPPYQLVTRAMPTTPDTALKTKMYSLIEEDGGTRLTVTLTGYEDDSDEVRWGRMEENTFGFGMMLQNMKAYLEDQPLPFPAGF